MRAFVCRCPTSLQDCPQDHELCSDEKEVNKLVDRVAKIFVTNLVYMLATAESVDSDFRIMSVSESMYGWSAGMVQAT